MKTMKCVKEIPTTKDIQKKTQHANTLVTGHRPTVEDTKTMSKRHQRKTKKTTTKTERSKNKKKQRKKLKKIRKKLIKRK